MSNLSTWDYQDFMVTSDNFVNMLDDTSKLRDQGMIILKTADDVREDFVKRLTWDIPDHHHPGAIDVALFEVGPDYMIDLEFE